MARKIKSVSTDSAVTTILVTGYNLLAAPKGFTKGELGRDKHGTPINIDSCYPEPHPDAVSFCTVGAIMEGRNRSFHIKPAMSLDAVHRTYHLARAIIGEVYSKYHSNAFITTINDHRNTTKKHILEMWREAIDESRKADAIARSEWGAKLNEFRL